MVGRGMVSPVVKVKANRLGPATWESTGFGSKGIEEVLGES